LEHPQITFSCSGFVHNVIVQARTHRIGTTWDVQSQRYTGKRVVKVANRELDVEEVFYVRPVGFYTNRKGKKYEWTEENRQRKLGRILSECEEYAEYYDQGMCEEHIRDYLPQAIRQNFVVSFNLRSVLHFMDLRSKLDAQLEIQALCDAFVPELKLWTPSVWEYYEEKRLHRARLSP
jgi:thymidylate synthase (FAD)